MKIAGMILVAALLAPAALVAQGPPGGAGRGMMRMPSPVAIAVAHKADLSLTEDQLTKLQAIETQLQAKNAPLMKQWQDARQGMPDFQSMTDEQRQQMREKMMPIMQQLRTNREAAQADAEKLLKPEQVTKLHEILQQEMPRRGPGGPGQGAPPPTQGK